jgi:hypothetical protein
MLSMLAPMTTSPAMAAMNFTPASLLVVSSTLLIRLTLPELSPDETA